MHPALLIVDLQKRFQKESPTIAASFAEVIPVINDTSALFRQCHLPVVFIQHKNEAEKLLPGVVDFDLPDELVVKPGDRRIIKTYGNAFAKTSLQADLQDLAVDSVVVCGFCAEYCVLDTCRGAKEADFKAFLLHNGLASSSREHIHFVEEINEGISFEALKIFFED